MHRRRWLWPLLAGLGLAALVGGGATGLPGSSDAAKQELGSTTTTEPDESTSTTEEDASTTTSTTEPEPTSTTDPDAGTTTSRPSSTTTTTEPDEGGPTCGGVEIEKPSGAPWVCTFEDDFDGSRLDRSKWVVVQTRYTGFGSGNECYVDDPDNVRVAFGRLRLTARVEEDPVECGDVTSNITTGSVASQGWFDQTYGRFEIRARFQAVDEPVPGLHGALWLWPRHNTYGPWPSSGEIDIAEVFSILPDRAMPALHYDTEADLLQVWNPFCFLDPSEWHTYVAEWDEEAIRISYDGDLCLDGVIRPQEPLEAPQPFDHPFFVALTQALSAGGANGFDPDVTPLPATMQVDYVRVWE